MLIAVLFSTANLSNGTFSKVFAATLFLSATIMLAIQNDNFLQRMMHDDPTTWHTALMRLQVSKFAERPRGARSSEEVFSKLVHVYIHFALIIYIVERYIRSCSLCLC